MTFYIEDETGSDFRFPVKEIAEMVANQVLIMENGPEKVQINLLITDNQGIREFNREYRNIDKDTDVLSFPNINFTHPGDFSVVKDAGCRADFFDPESDELILGDIIISADRVKSQAKEYGHSEKREFAFLVAHSMLHLCGYDHMNPKEAGVMEEKQENALKAVGITRD